MSYPPPPYQPPPYPGYPGGQPYPPYPPRPSKPVWPWVVGGVLLALVLVAGGCVALVGGIAYTVDREAKKEVGIVYEVDGAAASADITYYSGNFTSTNAGDSALPWRREVTVSGLAKSAGVSAQSDSSSTSLTCRILRDGKVIHQDSSSYGSVHCFKVLD